MKYFCNSELDYPSIISVSYVNYHFKYIHALLQYENVT